MAGIDRRPFVPQAPAELEPPRTVPEECIDRAIGWYIGDLPADLWSEARCRMIEVLDDIRDKRPLMRCAQV